MININNSAYVLVDVQERLMPVIHEGEGLIKNSAMLIEGLKILNIPIIWLEQFPKGLGPTCEPLKSLLEEKYAPIAKKTFSGFAHPDFQKELEALDVKKIIISGAESHVCVYQTTRDLLNAGYSVEIVADCISSRSPENRKIGIKKMLSLGAEITSVETILFELMETADYERFREISALIK